MAQTCSYCRSSISDGDAFCQICGRPAPAPANGLDMLAPTPEPPVAAVATGRQPSWPPRGGTGGLPSAPPTRGVQSAAAGGYSDPYVASRLTYTIPAEPTFDPLGSSRFLTQVLLRAALYFLTYVAAFTVIGFLFFATNYQAITSPITNSANSISAFSGAATATPSPGVNGFGYFLMVILFLLNLALTLSFWFLRVPIQLSEWKLTVDGKAAAAPMVFSHIAAVLYERGTPIAPMRVERFQLPGTGTRDYLELHSDIFYGYVACFAYGQDLYIGWTFWSKISPIRYVFMFLARLWQSLINRGSDLYIALRYDSARALRETIHSATREGVDVAVGRMEAQGQGIVGSAVLPVSEHAGPGATGTA
jgi:hypothetical protein